MKEIPASRKPLIAVREFHTGDISGGSDHSTNVYDL